MLEIGIAKLNVDISYGIITIASAGQMSLFDNFESNAPVPVHRTFAFF